MIKYCWLKIYKALRQALADIKDEAKASPWFDNPPAVKNIYNICPKALKEKE